MLASYCLAIRFHSGIFKLKCLLKNLIDDLLKLIELLQPKTHAKNCRNISLAQMPVIIMSCTFFYDIVIIKSFKNSIKCRKLATKLFFFRVHKLLIFL